MDRRVSTIAGSSSRIALSLLLVLLAGCGTRSADDSSGTSKKREPVPAVAGANVPGVSDRGGKIEAPPKTGNLQPQPSERTQISLELAGADLFPEFIPRNGEEHNYSTILESLGSGVAAIDFENDGWPDTVICGGGTFSGRTTVSCESAIFRNRWGTRFQDTTAISSFPRMTHYNHAVAVNDIDNDGFSDLVIAGYKGLQLLRNQGDGTFEDITARSGLTAPVWCASCAWGDFNRDSFPDLFVCGYVDWSFENDPPCYAADGTTRDNCSPKLFNAAPDHLFLGDGEGRWRDGSKEFQVRTDGKALGAVAADLDGDHWLDLYVGNDVMMNFLYRNVDGTQFEDRSISSGAGVSSRGSPDASMGIDVADFDGDGRFDLWAANFEMESFALYQNQGNLLFRHVSEATGVSAIGESYVGWGSAFVDLDLDGDEDVVVCNGNVVKHPQHSPALQRMVVLENIERSHFNEVTELAGKALMVPTNGRGLAVTDWNRDGRCDLLTSPAEFPAQLLINQSHVTTRGLWVKLEGTSHARCPVGTRLELRSGGRSQWRQLKGGGSYASSHLSEPHFVIHETDSPAKLIVTWPSGESKEYVVDWTMDRIIIVEGSDVVRHWPR